MNSINKKYINLPLILNGSGIVIDHPYYVNIIIDNIEFGSTYNYNIVTSNNNNPLTKNGLPYDDFSFTLFNADILSILADLSVGVPRVELTSEFEEYLMNDFLKKGHKMVITKDIEWIFKAEAISYDGDNDLYCLYDKLNERVSKSDIVKSIIAEKDFMSNNGYIPEEGFISNNAYLTEKGFWSDNGYIPEKPFKDLNLSLVYFKNNI